MTELLIMQLGITNRCNLRCIHCYDDSTQFKDMSMEEFTIAVTKVLETAENWGRYTVIWLTGGEPLVHPDFWKFIDFLQKKKDTGSHLSVYVLTNGTLVNEECVRQLESYSVLTDVQVSLDGTSKSVHEAIRGKGTYEKTMKALKRLVSSRLTTHIHMVVTKKNLNEAYTLPDLGLELGVNILTITRLVPTGRGKAMQNLMITPDETQTLYRALNEKQDEFEEENLNIEIARCRCDWPVLFYKNPTKKELARNGGHCIVGTTTFAVLEDGTVLPCRRLPIPIGNIFEQDLREIFDHPLLWQFRRKHTLMKGKCRNCVFNNDFWEYCSGGASCISYGYYGDPFMPDPHCPYSGKEEVIQ